MKNFLSVLVLSVLVTTASFASFPVKNAPAKKATTQTEVTTSENKTSETTAATSKANKKALKAQVKKARKARRQGDDNTVAIILAIVSVVFLPFGLHNWYLGRKKQALWQTLLTVIGIILAIILVGFVLILASWIWQVIDLVRLLTGGLN